MRISQKHTQKGDILKKSTDKEKKIVSIKQAKGNVHTSALCVREGKTKEQFPGTFLL
jgi:hypothetical protein